MPSYAMVHNSLIISISSALSDQSQYSPWEKKC